MSKKQAVAHFDQAAHDAVKNDLPGIMARAAEAGKEMAEQAAIAAEAARKHDEEMARLEAEE